MPQEDHAWDRIVDAIDTKFGILEHGRFARPVQDAQNLTQHVSFITFERDGQQFRLERIQGPAIIDKKTIGARRAGAEVRHQYIYDPDEISFKTEVFRREGDGWEPVDAASLGL